MTAINDIEKIQNKIDELKKLRITFLRDVTCKTVRIQRYIDDMKKECYCEDAPNDACTVAVNASDIKTIMHKIANLSQRIDDLSWIKTVVENLKEGQELNAYNTKRQNELLEDGPETNRIYEEF